MTLAIHVRLAGFLLLCLAALHPFFPRWFHWKAELARLSLLNRQIFLVHAGFLTLTLILMGSLCLLAPASLLDRSLLARSVAAGLAVFWAARLIVQFVVYSPDLWRGNRRRTALHIAAAMTWTYFTAVFAAAFLGSADGGTP